MDRFSALTIIKPLFFISLLVSVLIVNLYFLLSPTYVNWQYNRLAHNGQVAKSDQTEAIRIVNYIKTGTGKLPSLTEKERRHLADVRSVFNLGFTALKVSFLVMIVSLLIIKRSSTWPATFGYTALAGAGDTALLLIVALTMVFNFNWIFDWFHRLLFAGDSWLFAADDRLIQLFPFEFWMRAGLNWALSAAVELIMIAVLAGFLSRAFGQRRDI